MAKAKKARKKRNTHKKVKRRPVKKTAQRRKATAKRGKPRKRRSASKKVVKQVEKKSVERVLAGKRRRKRKPGNRRVRMAGPMRRRSVGKSGGSGKMLVGLAIGAAAIYFLTRNASRQPAYPSGYQLPPLTQTGNYTRNTQSQDIVNYAIAGGLAIDAVIKLIDRLNTSSDQEVQNIYDIKNTTGVQGLEYYV